MRTKTHYLINSYIPSDENTVTSNTYKLQSFGYTNKRHVWLAIDDSHGIGSGTDGWGYEDKEEALMSIVNFLNDGRTSYLYTNDFNLVLKKRQEQIESLTKELKDENNL